MAIYAMTGGATGIGAALKEQLRAQGDTVIVVDIKEGDVIADLSTPEGRQTAVDGVRAAAPDGLDGFIPCADLGSHIKPCSLIAAVNYFGVIATIEGLRDLVARKRGSILLVSVLLYGLVMIKTMRQPKLADEDVPEVPIAESIRHPQLTPVWLDRFKPWLIGAGALLVIAYGPQLVDQILNMNLNAPGPDFTPW